MLSFAAGWPQVRIALANLPYPDNRDDSIDKVVAAIREAASAGAAIVCFPECYVPGYRTATRQAEPPDAAFLDRAWAAIAAAAGRAGIAVILGTERVTDRGVLITALVINADGTIAGFQDKGQLDPSEEGPYRVRRRPSRLHGRTDDVRHLDLPRGLALSGDRALAREAWRAGRVPPAFSRSRAGQLPAGHVRGSQRTRFTKRPRSAAPPRTPASLRR